MRLMSINCTKSFHRLEMFNMKLILGLQNCTDVIIKNANIFF
jgi:hypothetical protein